MKEKDVIGVSSNGDLQFSITQKYITEIVSRQDEETRKCIEKYCEDNNIIPNIIEKEKLDLILKLGIEQLEQEQTK